MGVPGSSLPRPSVGEHLPLGGHDSSRFEAFSTADLAEELRIRQGDGFDGTQITPVGMSLSDFFSRETAPDSTSQLLTWKRVWAELGHEMPEPTDEQQTSLAATVEAYPRFRVVPAPLLRMAGRSAVVENAANLSDWRSDPDPRLFTLKIPEGMHGKLLEDTPGAVHKLGLDRVSLRYKTPTGELVDRAAYEESLLAAGQAVKGSDDSTWTFSVMDTRADSERDGTKHALDFYEALGAVSTPESLILVEIAHQAGGEPSTLPTTNFANEVIIRLTRKGKFVRIGNMTSVSLDPDHGQIAQQQHNVKSHRPHFGVRKVVSGIGE